jgi:hypothetical protein
MLREPFSGPARYNVRGHKLWVDVNGIDIPLPRVHHEAGWYIAFDFGTRHGNSIVGFEYDYGEPPG